MYSNSLFVITFTIIARPLDEALPVPLGGAQPSRLLINTDDVIGAYSCLHEVGLLDEILKDESVSCSMEFAHDQTYEPVHRCEQSRFIRSHYHPGHMSKFGVL